MSAHPNLLVIMADQLTGTLFSNGPAAFLKAPNLKRLARHSLCFSNCYTPSPLCAPARGAIMSGQMPSRTGIYDNAAEFTSDIPTYAHHLRRAGYQTILSGKMHFVGPDQMHGFEERLTPDMYPADFGWTPDYRQSDSRPEWWPHSMADVAQAGVAEKSDQMEYDDDVAFQAVQKLYQISQQDNTRPWCMTVSFTHPHDPFVARRKHWDLYENIPELEPPASIPYEGQDPHSKRLLEGSNPDGVQLSADDIRRARQAYFANISYLDDKIGELFAVMEATNQEAIVVFLSDHGEMLGERGLWFKMNFFEGAARVPLMISAADLAPQQIDAPVSTVDVCPTICALAGVEMDSVLPWCDGRSLLPMIHGAGHNMVAMEYAGEGSISPIVALREGAWKYVRSSTDPEMLFDLSHDPHERVNMAANPYASEVLAYFREAASIRWNLERYEADVRQSQAKRHVIYDALRKGAYYPWDYQPLRAASEQYMRHNIQKPNVLWAAPRFAQQA